MGAMQPGWRRPAGPQRRRSRRCVTIAEDRARRGGSGALNPQSALAGLNSLPREDRSGRSAGLRRRWCGSRAVPAREPGQVRKEAALSEDRQAKRELPDRSRKSARCGRDGLTTGGARSSAPRPADARAAPAGAGPPTGSVRRSATSGRRASDRSRAGRSRARPGRADRARSPSRLRSKRGRRRCLRRCGRLRG